MPGGCTHSSRSAEVRPREAMRASTSPKSARPPAFVTARPPDGRAGDVQRRLVRAVPGLEGPAEGPAAAAGEEGPTAACSVCCW